MPPRAGRVDEDTRPRLGARVRPGITVLLEDSLHLLRGKRIGLLTNRSGIDASGRSDVDLLLHASRSDTSGPRLVALFSPEHGIRGAEDRAEVSSGRDDRTGLPIHSLYAITTIEPPDSTLRGIDVLIVHLQDLGARPWAYPASMVYAMRAAARAGVRVLVLDRPNPITGERVEGPVLDSALANAGSQAPERRASPVAMYPIALRHGMTLGELARFYNEVLALGADLTVIPMSGWRRDLWFDETGLPWVSPSPSMPSLASATLYPGVVPFEGSNLSVGRGTAGAFQRVGAPWLDAARAVALLNDRVVPGVQFEAERFAPVEPSDRKYGGISVNWIRIVTTNRSRVQSARVGAAILWAVLQTNRDSLHLADTSFDSRMGTPRVRESLLRGEDPDEVIDRELAAVVAFQQRARRFHLYR